MLWQTKHTPGTPRYEAADAGFYRCWLGHHDIWQILLCGQLTTGSTSGRIEMVFVLSNEARFDSYVALLNSYQGSNKAKEKDEVIRLRAFAAIFGSVSPDLLLSIPGKEPFLPGTLSVFVFPQSWRGRAQEIERRQKLPHGTVRVIRFQSNVLATA